MFMKKIMVLLSLSAAMGYACAGFVDNRTAPGSTEVEAMYKSVPIEDLVIGLVPQSYNVKYAQPDMPKKKVTVVGKGPWDSLLEKALKDVSLHSTVDESARTVTIAAVALAPVSGGKADQMVSVAPAAPVLNYRVETSDGFVSRTVARWAQMANMQLVWEAAEVDYPVQAETFLGNDIRTALTGLFGALKTAQTPLRACIHNNQPKALIRIIRAGNSCQGAA